jgi:hypothetical protein
MTLKQTRFMFREMVEVRQEAGPVARLDPPLLPLLAGNMAMGELIIKAPMAAANGISCVLA